MTCTRKRAKYLKGLMQRQYRDAEYFKSLFLNVEEQIKWLKQNLFLEQSRQNKLDFLHQRAILKSSD